MDKDQPEEPLRPHPEGADDINPRDFILNTPMGHERVEELKRLMPERAKQGEFLVPNTHIGYEASFDNQANHAYFKKKYPWLHDFNGSLGLDVDKIERPYDREEQALEFTQFLIAIPSDDWEAFIEDVEYVKDNYSNSIDDDATQALRSAAEEEYWKDDGFDDLVTALKSRLHDDSFQQWVLCHMKGLEWDLYQLCGDAGHYMEEEGGGHIWMDEERAAKDIDWADIEELINESADREGRFNLDTLRRQYEDAKADWWNAEGGQLFHAACQRRAVDDVPFAAGLATMDDRRLKDVYDSVVTDENSGAERLPAYWAIADDDVPVRLVVGLGVDRQANTPVTPRRHNPEDTTEDAADEAAFLAHDYIVNYNGLPPNEHPELPFSGNLPKLGEAIDPRKFILQHPRSKLGDAVDATCPKCKTKRTLLRNWHDWIEDEGAASKCEKCGTVIPYSDFGPLPEAKIPDPYDPNKMGKEDVRDWILKGGRDEGELIHRSPNLYIFIPADDETLQKYIVGGRIPGYGKLLVIVPDPDDVHAKDPAWRTEYNWSLQENYGEIDMGYTDLQEKLNNPLYGKELRDVLISRYRGMLKAARAADDDDAFKEAALLLMAVGGQEALRGYYGHLRPGQIAKFDIRYGMLLLQKGRLAAAAKRLGVSRKQITRNAYLYAVDDWSDTTNLFYSGDREDYRGGAIKVFDGDYYEWFDHIEGDLSEAVDLLNEEHYQKIRELLTWAEIQNPGNFFETEEDSMVLSRTAVAELDNSEIHDIIKDHDEYDYDGRIDEIADAVTQAHRRSVETGYRDATYLSYTKALEDVLGPLQFAKIDGKDKLIFTIPWKDMLERLTKANEDQGDFDGGLNDLVENYSEPARPQDDPSPDWNEIKKRFPENCDEMLHEIKVLPPQQEPEQPGQLTLPLGEALLLEGYNYGCVMADLPRKHAEFLIDWGKLNITDEQLHNPPDDDTMGREDEIHTTVKYGLETKGFPEVVRKVAEQTPAFPVYIGAVSLFRSKDYDVVKLDVESPWLTAMHKAIQKAVPCPGDKHPHYHAHITIAYVKSGSCDHLVGQDPFEAEGSPGAEFVVNDVRYTGPGEVDGDRVKEVLPLDKTKKVQESMVKDFIDANAPRGYWLYRINSEGSKIYHGNGGWCWAMPDDRANAKVFEPSEIQNALAELEALGWSDVSYEPVQESLEKDFIAANAPHHYLIACSDESGRTRYLAKNRWTVYKPAAVKFTPEQAEAKIQKYQGWFSMPNVAPFWKNLRMIAESLERDFIMKPDQCLITATDPDGKTWWLGARMNWETKPFYAMVFSYAKAIDAEAKMRKRLGYANAVKKEMAVKAGLQPPAEWRNLHIEAAVEESVEKDFIMTNAPSGWHVKVVLPGHAKPMYFQSFGKFGYNVPGRPVPIDVAERMVEWIRERFGPRIDSYTELVPV